MQPAWVEDRHEDLQSDQYSKNGTLLAKTGFGMPTAGLVGKRKSP